MAEPTNDLQQTVARLLAESDAAAAAEHWDDLVAVSLELCSVLESAGDREGALQIRLRAGQALECLHRLDEARQCYARVRDEAAAAQFTAVQAAALHRLGHLARLRDPPAARELFAASLAVDASDAEGAALSRAMIGQIDFTEGDLLGGCTEMLRALSALPPESPAFDHVLEHTRYFGGKLPRDEYLQLVACTIEDASLRDRLHEAP
ncbi:MAG: hypothetical protein KY476_09755 [Planctomycetes bacterium]|nr:hypothetical protein [Planctomycetota bacterium]